MSRSASPPAPAGPFLAAAFLIAATMLFWGLGRPALMQPDEGRNAEVAREMAAAGSWWEPTLEGLPYLDKPVTFFACAAASMKIFGATEGPARLPSALCGFIALVVVGVVLRRRAGDTAAALAVTIAATSPMVFVFSRLVIMDMMLAVCTTASILAAFTAEDLAGPARTLRYLLAAAAAGAGFIVKGPVGVLVPMAVLVAYHLASGTRDALRRLFSPWNALAFLAIAAPWFLGVVYSHPDFFHYGVVQESLGRFFTRAFNRGRPFWFFGPVFVAGTLPWCVLFVPIGRAVWRSRRALPAIDRLLAIWVVVDVVFFSLSRTKQPGYILSGVIAAGALTGTTVARAWEEPAGRTAASIARWTKGFGIAAAALGVVFTVAAIRPSLLPFRVATSSPDAAWLAAALPGFVAGSMAAGFLAFAAVSRRSLRATALAFAAFPLAIVTLAFPGVCLYAEARSARPVAQALAQLPAEVPIVGLSTYAAGLSFYLGRTVTLLSDDASQLGSNYVVYRLRHRSDWPPNVIPWKDRSAWLASRRGPVYLLADAGGRPALELLARERGASVTEVWGEWSGALLTAPGP